MSKPNKSKFIVFEGLDGSGKTTQCQLLSAWLTEKNIPNIVTREPTSSPLGTILRDALKKKITLENETIALLFAADRYQHTAEEIIPELERGKFVLCDRYFYSSMAYQGYDNASLYNHKVISGCIPDITFFIDVPPVECLARIKRYRDGIELYESLEELEQEREGYLKAFEKTAKNKIAMIDAGSLHKEAVFEKIKAELDF